MPKLVIKKHRPFALVFAVVLVSVLPPIILWTVLNENYWSFIKYQLGKNEVSRSLWDVNQNLETENATLKEKIIMLERLTQIDNQAAVNLQNDIQSLQDEVYRLKGELEFYEGIMSATADSNGVNVSGLHIEQTDEDQIFRFKLILTNVAKGDKIVKVVMDMSVEGVSEAGTQVLALKDIIVGDGTFKREIQFRDFERIRGNLIFPKTFRPLRVIVVLQRKGSKKPKIKKVFEWPANVG